MASKYSLICSSAIFSRCVSDSPFVTMPSLTPRSRSARSRSTAPGKSVKYFVR